MRREAQALWVGLFVCFFNLFYFKVRVHQNSGIVAF